jgi:hypothetical protein
MTSRSLRPLLALALSAAFALGTSAAEVARLAFSTGQESFELSPAGGGVQTLTIAANAADVQWVSPAVGQKFSGGQLVLLIPVGPGESVISAKPQALPAGGTLFVFSTVSAPVSIASSPAVAPSPAPTVTPSVVAPSPAPIPLPSAPVAPSSPPSSLPAPTAAPVMIAPASSVVTAPLLSPTPGSTSTVPKPVPTPSAPRAPSSYSPTPGAAVGALPPDIKNLITQFLPEPEKIDPLAKADFAIPESPGAAVLDQTAQILRPASPHETVTSLLSNFDPNGALKTGFSVAITPYTLFRSQEVSLREYSESSWKRFFTRLQVSLAAKTGSPSSASATATSPAFFGLGVSGVFFDDSDPRLDTAMLKKLQALFPTTWGSQADADAIALGRPVVIPSVEQSKIDAHHAITQAAQNARWNAAAMGFGYALRLTSPTGQIDDAKEDGGAAWLNYGLPGFGALKENSQFLFTASYRYHDTFTRNATTGLEDTFNIAAQYRVGSADFNGFGQAVHHWRAPRNGAHSSDTTVELGLEKRVMEGLWFALSWTNDKSLGGNSAIKTGLRFGFGEGATLGNPK